MKKRVFKKMVAVFSLLAITASAFSQADNLKTITVEINHVLVNGGTVYVSASLSDEAYKKQKPDVMLECEPSDSVIKAEMSLPTGDCVINVYQDRNGNGKCDKNLLGIPKEPVGITNWDGKGVPGNFAKLKVGITPATQTISINLYQL